MKEPKDIFEFIKRCKKFVSINGCTLHLKVDDERILNDLPHDVKIVSGCLIGEMENCLGELIDELIKFYEKEGDIKMINKLKKL